MGIAEADAGDVIDRNQFMAELQGEKDQEQFELTDAQKAELDRRLAAHEADPDRGNTWQEVKAKLLSE